jgi:ACT domain-containing protein
MFAIYRKNVGGRITDRYFKNYAAARRELHADVVRMCDVCHAKITERIDRMNVAKGFYEYEVRMTLANGETASLAIVDGYFEDEPNE